MNDYSIELSAERIVDIRIKRYFTEVAGSYAAGYYRSAVVMLWSVVVTDLLFKLDQLANAYSDPTAKLILKEIGDLRRTNPNSPDWETELIDKINKKTDLIDASEFSCLKSLQAHRHLSAHPVLTSNEALFSPNKETTRAHIRNALDGVLTKPPIMSRRIFDAFIEDVEQMSRLGSGKDELERYLKVKYFDHFSTATFEHVFKSLWRVTFKSEDPRCEANRRVNVETLAVVLDQRKNDLMEIVRHERAWFSDISLKDGPLDALARFFRRYPAVYPLLNDAVKTPIEKYASLNLDNFSSCLFVSSNPQAHVDVVMKRVENGEWLSGTAYRYFCTSVRDTNVFETALHIGIRLYGLSPSFDTADSRFSNMIQPFLQFYTKDHILAFLQSCEGCYRGQATGRGRAEIDHDLIKMLINEKFPTISLGEYPEFSKTIERTQKKVTDTVLGDSHQIQ